MENYSKDWPLGEKDSRNRDFMYHLVNVVSFVCNTKSRETRAGDFLDPRNI